MLPDGIVAVLRGSDSRTIECSAAAILEGGITIADIPSYRLPSVASLALGGELTPAAAVAAGNWAHVRDRAARAVAARRSAP